MGNTRLGIAHDKRTARTELLREQIETIIVATGQAIDTWAALLAFTETLKLFLDRELGPDATSDLRPDGNPHYSNGERCVGYGIDEKFRLTINHVAYDPMGDTFIHSQGSRTVIRLQSHDQHTQSRHPRSHPRIMAHIQQWRPDLVLQPFRTIKTHKTTTDFHSKTPFLDIRRAIVEEALYHLPNQAINRLLEASQARPDGQYTMPLQKLVAA